MFIAWAHEMTAMWNRKNSIFILISIHTRWRGEGRIFPSWFQGIRNKTIEWWTFCWRRPFIWAIIHKILLSHQCGWEHQKDIEAVEALKRKVVPVWAQYFIQILATNTSDSYCTPTDITPHITVHHVILCRTKQMFKFAVNRRFPHKTPQAHSNACRLRFVKCAARAGLPKSVQGRNHLPNTRSTVVVMKS